MNQDAVTSWLRKKKAWGLAQHVSVGVLVFCAGLVVVFLTFWFTYAIVWFGWHGVSALSDLAFGRKLPLSHAWRLACSGVFLVLLFVQHFRTNPWYWGQYPDRNYADSPNALRAAAVFGEMGCLLAYPGASANMIADILLSGPRLVTGGCKLVARGIQLKRLDESGCAALLAFLHARTGAVAYEELSNAGWEAWFGQLRCIDGVQFLQKGLMLSGELRSELNSLSGDQNYASL